MIHKWTFTVLMTIQVIQKRTQPVKLAEPSLSSAPHEWEAGIEETVTVACIMDCSTIMVHARKSYEALIDLGASISLIRYSSYKHIDNSFKTPIQPTTAKLNTADGSLMKALGITALHLRIADSKFTHNFVLCNRLPDMEIILGIDIQKKFLISYAWGKDKNCYIQKEGKFLTYTRNCEQKATIGVVKSTLKILPRHNGAVQLRSQVKQLRNIWLTSSLMRTQQKEGTQI